MADIGIYIQTQTIFTAGEDGLIKAWLQAATTAEAAEQQMYENDETALPTYKKAKRKNDSARNEGSKARFKPY